jgi:hypothetical protein
MSEKKFINLDQSIFGDNFYLEKHHARISLKAKKGPEYEKNR